MTRNAPPNVARALALWLAAGFGVLAPAGASAEGEKLLPRLWEFAYSPAGRPTMIRNPVGEEKRFHYDEFGWLDRIDFPGGDQVTIVRDPNHQPIVRRDASGEWRFEYDPLGRLKGVQPPEGDSVRYDYDGAGRVRRLELGKTWWIQYEYDLFDRLTKVSSPLGDVTFERDPALTIDGKSRPQVIRRLPNGVRTVWTYDSRGRLVGLRHDRGDQLLAGWTYSYDSLGRIVGVQDAIEQATFSYAYDSSERLIEMRRNETAIERYQYDDAGKLRHAAWEAASHDFAFDGFGQLAKVDGHLAHYDRLGRLTDVGTGAVPRAFGYGDDGQMTLARIGGQDIHYVYDAAGRLVKRLSPGGTLVWQRDLTAPDAPVLAIYENGKRVAERLLAGGTVATRLASGDARFLLEDQLGDIRVVTDAEGRVVGRRDYASFGALPTAEGPNVAPGFANGVVDPQTGLVRLGVRWYDPETGQFLTPDPLQGELTDPRTWDRYLYALGDPVNHSDPTGMATGVDDPVNDLFTAAAQTEMAKNAFEDWIEQQIVNNYMSEPNTTSIFAPTVANYSNILLETVRVGFDLYYDFNFSSQIGSGFKTIRSLENFLENPTWSNGRTAFLDTANFAIGYIPGERLLARGVMKDAEKNLFRTGGLDRLIETGKIGEYNQVLSQYAKRVAKQVDWLGKTTASLLFDKALPKRAEADASRDVFEPNPNAGGEKKPPHTTGLPEPGMRELEGHHGVACQASSGLCPPSAASRTDFREPRPDGVRVPGRGEDPPEKPQVSVGGVYLDPVAQTALRLSSLKGVSIDAATGRLTLIGEGVETSAVPVDLDDLAVAIAAAASRTSWPGVTIDPPPGNPESPIAYYKYFGPMTENTHFGGVLALADRWMKSISVGFDNEHPETIVRPNAPDFKDSFQLGAEFASPQANGWSRFWIVPASVKWETSADGLALWCSEARMAVNTQTMVVQNGRLVDSPGVHRASDEAFAAWFTNHYDDLARQYPVYAELRELAKLVSLAAVLKDRLPHDEFLRISQTLIPTRSATPTQTPTVRTTKTLGDMQVTILGGVDLEPDKAAFSSPGPKGEALKAAVALTTPAISVPTISEVEIGARKYEAVSIPPVSLYHPGALILDEADFDSVGWGLVARRYDSGVATVGPYGPGWRMERPRIALPDENSGKQPQIPASTLAMLNLDKQPVFNLMEIGNDKIRLRTVEGGDFLVGRDGRLLHGESDQLKIDYQEEGGRLESIVHRPSRGEPWRTAFKYEGDQLTTVTDDRLGTINYQYDPEGRLAEMRSAHRLVRYRYDEHGRLSQRLENGRVENYQIAADGEALAVSDADGVKISFRSTLDSSGRLKREIADFAAPQSLRFDERGDIAAVEGRGWTLETARAGNVEGSTLHLGTTTEWSRQVDPIARRIVEQVRDDRTLTSKLRADGGPESTVVSAANGGEQVDVHYDIDGEWLSISDSDGTGLQRSRDAQGRVEEISAPQGDYRFSFDSAMNSVEVEGPENLRIRMALDRDGKAREIEESDDHGPRAWSRANPSTWEFRAAGQLLRTIEEGEIGRVVGSRYGGLEVRAEHSLGGSLIVTPDGRQTLGRIDRDGRPLEIEEYPTGTPKLALPCLDVTGEKVVDQSPEEDQRPDKPQ